MRKILTVILLCTAFLLSAAGCEKTPNPNKNEEEDIPVVDIDDIAVPPTEIENPEENEQNPGITTNKIPYNVIEEQELNQEIKDIVEELKVSGGYKVYQEEGQDSQYIVIALGERNTGGYSVEIVSVEDVEGNISVVYREKEPNPDDMVVMIMTYPYIVIKVDLPLPVTVIKEEPKDEIPYTIVEEQEFTQEVKDIVEELKTTGGYKIYEMQEEGKDFRYVIIALGERPTGGYNAEIVSVKEVEGNISVIYREKVPGPADAVLAEISYPYTVIKINSSLPVIVTQV